MKKIGISVALVLVLAVLCSFDFPLTKLSSLYLSDISLSLAFGVKKAERSLVVEIDRKTLSYFQYWPFSRMIHTLVQKHLMDAGAKCAVWDILFLGDDKNNPESIARFYKYFFDEDIQIRDSIERDFDSYFVGELRRGSAILGYIPEFYKNSPYTETDKFQGIARGHIVHYSDRDGLVRTIPAYLYEEGRPIPALGLIAAERYDREKAETIQPSDTIRLKERRFQTLSFVDVFNNTLDPAKIRDKVVFIGASEEILHDIQDYPFGRLPGVFSHAIAFEEILDGPILFFPALYSILFGLSTVFFLYYWCKKFSYKKIPAVTLSCIVFILLCSYGFLLTEKSYYDPFPAMLFCLASGSIWLYCGIQEEKKRIVTISRYVAPEVAQLIVDSNEPVPFIEGTEREITVMFSDLHGFTSLSETLSPRDVQRFLNAYFTPITETIQEQEGIVDKFIGDEVMALWNAPLYVTDHPLKALRTAFEIPKILDHLQKNLPITLPKGYVLRCATGLNTGTAYIGDMGTEKACSYTALGSTVNLTSRIEHLCSVYYEDILVSEAFARRFDLWSIYRFLLVDIVQVKGIEKPEWIYKPVLYDNGNALAVDAIENWLAMEKAFRQHDVQGAWKFGEKALATGYFQNVDGYGKTCQQYFLESILSRYDRYQRNAE